MKPDFDDIYMELAVNLSKKSHCVKRQVGAVLAKDTRIISIGYNGPPAGTHNCDLEWPETGCARDSRGSCSLALHAEENAIYQLVQSGIQKTKGDNWTIYCTTAPCRACAKMINGAGITRVVYNVGYPDDYSVEYFKKYGIELTRIPTEL